MQIAWHGHISLGRQCYGRRDRGMFGACWLPGYLEGCRAETQIWAQIHREILFPLTSACVCTYMYTNSCSNPPPQHTHNWSDRKFQEMNAWRRQGSLSFRTQVLMCCPNCIVLMLWSRDSLSRAAKHYVPSRFVVPNSQGAVLYREICHTAEEVQVKPHYFTISSFYEVCAGPLITTAFLHVGRSGVAKKLPSS